MFGTCYFLWWPCIYLPFACREKANGNEVFVYESQTNKGKVTESDITEYDNMAKTDLKKNDSKPEMPPSMVEKEAAQAKIRNQTFITRQTQSGPLMPGSVLSHSQSERMRNLERFDNFFLFASSYLFIFVMCRQ